jgi:tetratricopeptide (TPR) repeat protein
MDKLDRSQYFKLDNALAYINRGYNKLESRDIYGAIYDFDRAMELDPNQDLGYLCRGQAKRDAGDINGAIDDYDRAEELNPNNAGLYTSGGILRSRIDAIQSAITENAIPINEVDVDLYTSASNLDNEGDIVDDLNPSTNIQSDNTQSDYILGKAKLESDDISGAIDEVDREIELICNPKHPLLHILYFNRGCLKQHEKIQNYQEALADFDRVIQLNPNKEWKEETANDYYDRGTTKADELHDYQGALADYDLAILFNPNLHVAYCNRGVLKHIRCQDFEGALADYDRAIQLNPDRANTYANRGTLKTENLQDYEGALTDFSRAIQLNPDNAHAHNMSGFLKYFIRKDRSGGIIDMQQAARLYQQQGNLNLYQKVIDSLNELR